MTFAASTLLTCAALFGCNRMAPAPEPAQAVAERAGDKLRAALADTAPSRAPAQAPAAAPAPAAPNPQAAFAEAQQIYAQRCSLCHGAGGKGDGVAAVNLRPQPRTFVDAAWQKSTRDEDVAMIIVRGGRSVGKSMMMPASGDLADRPEVVRALVEVVRGFGPKGP